MVRKQPASKLVGGSLPRTVKVANTGPIDPAFLDRPKAEEWGGWGSVVDSTKEVKK